MAGSTYPDAIPLPFPFRIPLLFLDVTLAFVTLNLALIYFSKHRKTRGSLKASQVYLAWCTLFLGLGTTLVLYVIGDFYSTSLEQRLQVFRYAYFFGGLGNFFFIYNIEKLPYLGRRRVFTKIFLVLIILLALLNVAAEVYEDLGILIQAFVTMFWLPNIGLTIKYFNHINRVSLGKFKGQTVVMLVGFILLILGLMGATDVMTRLAGLGFRMAADVLTIIAILILATFSLKLPSFKELDWKDSICSLVFIYKGGIIAYRHDFKEYDGKERLNDGLTAGALESSKLMLDGIMKGGELKVLDFQDKKIYYEPGLYVTTIIIAEDRLESIEILLHKVSDAFESFFADTLPGWDGDNRIFLPTKVLVQEIFA